MPGAYDPAGEFSDCTGRNTPEPRVIAVLPRRPGTVAEGELRSRRRVPRLQQLGNLVNHPLSLFPAEAGIGDGLAVAAAADRL